MNNKICFLIDVQNDFISGSLAVNGAQEKMDALCEFIRENGEMYDQIFITADWHPISHLSFKENGGEWPVHCVQHTNGASIYEPLMKAIHEKMLNYTVLTKGDNEDREEYSVFRNESSSKTIKTVCDILKVKDIDFCGIAMDYCVKDSILDAKRELSGINLHLYKDFSPAIGNPEETLLKLEDNGIHII